MSDEPVTGWTLEYLKEYRGTLRIRRDPKFGEVRPEVEEYEGVTAVFRDIGVIDCSTDEFANKGYDGEHLMETPRSWPVGWVASGDLINLEIIGELMQ